MEALRIIQVRQTLFDQREVCFIRIYFKQKLCYIFIYNTIYYNCISVFFYA